MQAGAHNGPCHSSLTDPLQPSPEGALVLSEAKLHGTPAFMHRKPTIPSTSDCEPRLGNARLVGRDCHRGQRRSPAGPTAPHPIQKSDHIRKMVYVGRTGRAHLVLATSTAGSASSPRRNMHNPPAGQRCQRACRMSKTLHVAILKGTRGDQDHPCVRQAARSGTCPACKYAVLTVVTAQDQLGLCIAQGLPIAHRALKC